MRTFSKCTRSLRKAKETQWNRYESKKTMVIRSSNKMQPTTKKKGDHQGRKDKDKKINRLDDEPEEISGIFNRLHSTSREDVSPTVTVRSSECMRGIAVKITNSTTSKPMTRDS